MTQDHPITPPPELVTEWWNQYTVTSDNLIGQFATQAARWGADQELEACRLWVSENCGFYSAVELIQFRRPKPPSLKEEALKMLDNLERCTDGDYYTIRFALEQLDD